MRLAIRDSRFARYASSRSPANAVPPSVAATSRASSARSSAASASSSPRGQGAKKRWDMPPRSDSERLRDDEPDDRDEQRQRRDLVQPAIEDMVVTIAITREIAHQHAEVDVQRDQHEH